MSTRQNLQFHFEHYNLENDLNQERFQQGIHFNKISLAKRLTKESDMQSGQFQIRVSEIQQQLQNTVGQFSQPQNCNVQNRSLIGKGKAALDSKCVHFTMQALDVGTLASIESNTESHGQQQKQCRSNVIKRSNFFKSLVNPQIRQQMVADCESSVRDMAHRLNCQQHTSDSRSKSNSIAPNLARISQLKNSPTIYSSKSNQQNDESNLASSSNRQTSQDSTESDSTQRGNSNPLQTLQAQVNQFMYNINRPWKPMIAGAVAGVVPTILLQPLDVIKTRLQVQEGVIGSSGVLYRGAGHACRCMISQEGFRSLYQGLTPALVGSSLAWGVYMFAYDKAKSRYKSWCGDQNLTPFHHFISALEAGAMGCVLTNPVWVIRTRLQLQHRGILAAQMEGVTGGGTGIIQNALKSAGGVVQQSASAVSGAARQGVVVTAGLSCPRLPPKPPTPPNVPTYRGFIDAMRQIAAQEGIRGFYRGLVPSLALISNGALNFMVYEEMKRFIGVWKVHTGSDGKLGAGDVVLAGSAAKVIASTTTYPLQVIRSRMMQRAGAGVVRPSTVTALVRHILQKEGIQGLYKGIIPNLLRVTPQQALFFLTYETVLAALR